MTASRTPETLPHLPVPWRRGIPARTLALLAVALLPFLAVGAAVIFLAWKDAGEKAEKALFSLTAELSRQIGSYLTELEEDMDFLGSHFDQRDLGGRENVRLLAMFASSHRDLRTVWLLDESGAGRTLYARGEIDLLLTDVAMPGMNGRELSEALLCEHPRMKVAYMSGYTENVIFHQGVLESGTHYIGKPLRPVHLARKVREFLDRDPSRQD